MPAAPDRLREPAGGRPRGPRSGRVEASTGAAPPPGDRHAPVARVSVNGCFILGLDAHTPDVFGEVLEFVRSSGLAEVQYTVLTPFPGTPLYARLDREGRLLQKRFWDRCTLFDVTFRPKRMTVEELEAGLRWLFRETYTRRETEARLLRFVAQRRDARLAAYGALALYPAAPAGSVPRPGDGIAP